MASFDELTEDALGPEQRRFVEDFNRELPLVVGAANARFLTRDEEAAARAQAGAEFQRRADDTLAAVGEATDDLRARQATAQRYLSVLREIAAVALPAAREAQSDEEREAIMRERGEAVAKIPRVKAELREVDRGLLDVRRVESRIRGDLLPTCPALRSVLVVGPRPRERRGARRIRRREMRRTTGSRDPPGGDPDLPPLAAALARDSRGLDGSLPSERMGPIHEQIVVGGAP